MREILINKRGDLEKKDNIINSKKISHNNELNLNKEKLIASFFNTMKSRGVDLNDMESISNFLVELESSDPEMKDLFEYVFNLIIEDKEEPDNNEDSLMNKFDNLGPETMMPRE